MDKPIDLVICGVALVTLAFFFDTPIRVIAPFLRGWLAFLGIGMIARAYTMRSRPRLDRALSWVMIFVSVMGMILVLGHVLLVGG